MKFDKNKNAQFFETRYTFWIVRRNDSNVETYAAINDLLVLKRVSNLTYFNKKIHYLREM